jgi:hypothetical protein
MEAATRLLVASPAAGHDELGWGGGHARNVPAWALVVRSARLAGRQKGLLRAGDCSFATQSR